MLATLAAYTRELPQSGHAGSSMSFKISSGPPHFGGKVTPCPIFHSQNAVVAVGYDHTHCLAVPRVNVADIELKGPGSILSADETAGVFSLAATEK
jgi:hypothetical protein